MNSSLSSEFVNNTDTYEGDCLSCVLFTLVLAVAMNHVRVATSIPNPPIAFNGMPTQTSYADDVDFINENDEILMNNIPKIKNMLEEWDLFINDERTEFTNIYLAGKDEKDEKGIFTLYH